MTDLEGARDDIQLAFKTQWDADAPGVTGEATAPFVQYEGAPREDAAEAEDPWARVTIRHVGGSQASLSDETGHRRFEKYGIVTVSVFTPLVLAGGLRIGERLSQVAKKAFEGRATASGIWFRDVRVVEVGLDGPWYQFNVLAEFRYDELV